MNKIIFQVGILGFCIAAVVIGGNGGSVFEIVSRSFIVFVGIVLAITAIVVIAGTMVDKSPRRGNAQAGHQQTNAQHTQQ